MSIELPIIVAVSCGCAGRARRCDTTAEGECWRDLVLYIVRQGIEWEGVIHVVTVQKTLLDAVPTGQHRGAMTSMRRGSHSSYLVVLMFSTSGNHDLPHRR